VRSRSLSAASRISPGLLSLAIVAAAVVAPPVAVAVIFAAVLIDLAMGSAYGVTHRFGTVRELAER
jgi:hypothetical protein